MGSDDVFRRKKTRKAADLGRKFGKRKPYDKILIVCEGSKTEPFYFNEIIKLHKLSTANVLVDKNEETCPLKLFKHARKVVKEHAKTGVPFDKVYCVFDKDSHVHYEDAKNAINDISGKKIKYEAITSVPSFEYWLLLHFKKTTKPYVRAGSKSSGDVVLAELKQEFPDYVKAKKDVYGQIKDRQESAIANAQFSRKQALLNGNDNPTTRVDELVNALISLNN